MCEVCMPARSKQLQLLEMEMSDQRESPEGHLGGGVLRIYSKSKKKIRNSKHKWNY